MNKRGEGDIGPLPGVLTRLLMAFIFIVVVVAAGYAVSKALLHSDDKSSEKSFDTLSQLMESKFESTKVYDSSRINIYLYGNSLGRYGVQQFRIFYFPANSDRWNCGVAFNKEYHVLTPSYCEGKACLCLYSNTPDAEDRDNHLVKCTTFDNELNVKEFELNNNLCNSASFEKFTNIIVASKLNPTNNEKSLHVWLYNEENIKKDELLKRPVCPLTDNNICKGQSSNQILSGNDWYPKILAQCKQQNLKTLSGTCVFDKNTNSCEFKCNPDISCLNNVQTCSDYNKYSDDGYFNENYIVENSAAYYACNNDKDVCNINAKGCMAKRLTYYICQDKDACESKYRSFATACNMKETGFVNNGEQIITYEDAVLDVNGQQTSCFNELSQIYKQAEINACKKNTDCQSIFEDSKNSACKFLFFVGNNGQRILLDYQKSLESCNKLVTDNFEKAFECVGK